MILIGADIVPTQGNVEYFKSGNTDYLFGKELVKILSEADYRIFNLEVPLTDVETPIKKCGPNLIAPTAAINGYKAAKIDFLTLANNHILDQGEQGLHSTIESISNAGIAYAGVGENPAEAAKPYVIESSGKKIGIYCCTEHEFSIVTDHSAGANPFDPLESPDHVAKLKAKCDYVIFLYHGGREHYRYPSPELQKVCRKLVDKGADLVICQHSHCVGCEEKYNNGTICYGQGNFLFDNCEQECWQTGLLISISFDSDSPEIKYIPVRKNGHAVSCASAQDAAEILKGFNARSEEICQRGFIKTAFEENARKNIDGYLYQFVGKKYKSILVRGLNKLLHYRLVTALMNKNFPSDRLLPVINYLTCEARREELLCGLKDKQANDSYNNR